MLYAALAFFVVALLSMTLGFLGVIRGAAGLVSLSLLASLVFLVGAVISTYRRRELHS